MIRNILITLAALPILTMSFSACTDAPASSPECPLDIDGSGIIDFHDIGAFFKALDAGEAPASWDFDGNGEVNSLDALVILDMVNGVCI